MNKEGKGSALAAETLRLERRLNAECGMRIAECRVVLPRLHPDPRGGRPNVANRPAPEAPPATCLLAITSTPRVPASLLSCGGVVGRLVTCR